MTPYLAGKHILLGVTGSIAAYKSADLIRRLREAGAIVRVAMTENAKQFITPLTLQAVSGFPIHDSLFDPAAEAAMGHIELARWADRILIAPASADMLARLAEGRADDLLTTLCLATKAPILVAPAMNQGMFAHPLTQANQAKLLARGFTILGPAMGSQACGDVGFGRMLEPLDIVQALVASFQSARLAGINLLLTAGPTHEAIDPVRYLTNASSGKMGYALALAAREAGAHVTLISGPTQLTPPESVHTISVISALDMHDAVMERIAEQDIFIGVAAVSDYRPASRSLHKIHKSDAPTTLNLVRNPDIIEAVGARAEKPFIVGFAAETDNVIESAKQKLLRKKMDLIIANAVEDSMGQDDNTVTLLSLHNEIKLPKMRKTELASVLIEQISIYYHR